LSERTIPHEVTTLPIRTLEVHVVQGPDTGRRFVAESNTIDVGTADDNDLVLTDKTVSRYHLALEHLGDHISLVDHGSTNGTWAGKASIEKGRVKAGAVLNLGTTAIRIEDGRTMQLELHDSEELGPVSGRSPRMRGLMVRLRRTAETNVSVLLLGETGSGKEVAARAIHEVSARHDRPFEVVDCGALSPTLVASELFGHERGAFTGADTPHAGAFERADGGTLFLDEIGELPQSLQAALLGAIERRSFRRVGGSARIDVDVRIISATNRDLRADVNSGIFRQDLYYRLGVVKLEMPPLRERPEDIPLLVERFLREAGHEGPIEEVIAPNVMEALCAHRWPGNVRELRNFLENALVLGETPQLEEMRERAQQGESSASGPRFPSASLPQLFALRYKEARTAILDEFESLYLTDVLGQAQGNVSEASRRAGIHRSYMTQMLKRHKIKTP
jgi:DNA-binding NtrC family response regulator